MVKNKVQKELFEMKSKCQHNQSRKRKKDASRLEKNKENCLYSQMT